MLDALLSLKIFNGLAHKSDIRALQASQKNLPTLILCSFLSCKKKEMAIVLLVNLVVVVMTTMMTINADHQSFTCVNQT